jgi:uncharacterized protein YjbI with pentapeptide repeats
MANQQHIDIIKQGVKRWNQWRVENQNIEPDLSDYAFTKRIINNEPQINFKGANLKRVNLAGSRLRLADLRNADLSEANLQKTNLSGAFLLQANLNGANLSAAILQGANLRDAKLNNAVLRGANLSQGKFMGHEFYFEKTIFEVPKWRRGNYFFEQTRKTILRNATLSRSDLRWADFSNADLMGVGLSDANLYATMFRGANLREVDFDGACLYETNLNLAILNDANFSHSKLKSTYFINVDLSNSQGLDKVRHDGPSTISMDTLFRSHGNIPVLFFQGAGAPKSFIELYETFSPDDFDNCSCFISFSASDQEFVQKLYDDLQREGIRIWLVPDEMKQGDPNHPRIYQEIQSTDKLLLVLSENSVNSDWIECEVNLTLEQERRINADIGDDELPIPVLLPILIDSSIIEAKQFWARNIREERHINNFSEWQNKTAYKSAFDRLLKDLKNTSHYK